MNYLLYDVFTREPLLGNPLAVYLDGSGLDLETMQRIAREMNLSETTFVLPAEAAHTDFRVRIFTPAVEMPMAGHPTIGTTFALAETGAVPHGTPRIVLGLNVGPIPVDLEWGDNGLRFAWMTQPAPLFGPVVEDRAMAVRALGLDVEALAPGLPVQEVSCGVPFVYVPLRDRAEVDRAVPQSAGELSTWRTSGSGMSKVEDVGPSDVETAVFLFAVDPPGASSGEADVTVYSRMFAPSLGIAEDPATGSASGPLGCYLVEHRIVAPESATRIVSHQGVKMGRASRIHIAIDGAPGRIERVRIGGEAVLAGRGELLLSLGAELPPATVSRGRPSLGEGRRAGHLLSAALSGRTRP